MAICRRMFLRSAWRLPTCRQRVFGQFEAGKRRIRTSLLPQRDAGSLSMIPLIDSAALFGGPSPARDRADSEIHRAATGVGFLMIRDLPTDIPLGTAARRRLLRLFDLPEAEIRKLWRQKFN